MGFNVAQKLIQSHLLEGKMEVGNEIGMKIDQTLTQDATGTMVMLELEAMKLDHVKTEVSAQYVDHNLLRTDAKNSDDHVFLYSACQRFGVWYSRPGNGVSHPVHMQRFGKPGKTMLGSDSHTVSAGSMAMLAIGAGGLEVAMAMAGHPFYVNMPKIWGVKLTGTLPPWVSAKDVILELLRRHDVKGGINKIIEYYGPGLDSIPAMDRHTIANMGAELGATTTVFPSDQAVKHFLEVEGRGDAWVQILPDPDCSYDLTEEIHLDELEPLIALPSSPGKVKPVADVAGKDIMQSYIGSSANPGYRDIAISALMLRGRRVHERVSLDINPTSLEIEENLLKAGLLEELMKAGARIHEPGCNGCIGMGQAAPTKGISLRTVPRNFPGRSGSKHDLVYLCSPETATASAITGVITDPRSLDFPYPIYAEPQTWIINTSLLVPPLKDGTQVKLIKGPNIKGLPPLTPVPENLEIPVIIKVGDNISTDEIMPAGARVLPYRSNIPKISHFVFSAVDTTFYARAMQNQKTGFAIVAGDNYGQGSSREHAALAPRYLGLKLVLARSFARIHWQNLVDYGIVTLKFEDPADWDKISQGDMLFVPEIEEAIRNERQVKIINKTKNETYLTDIDLSDRQKKAVLAGSLLSLASIAFQK